MRWRHDVVEFCKKLTLQEREAGNIFSGQAFTLSTEAQWEFAARVGTQTAYSSGKVARSLEAAGWYRDNSRRKAQVVGEKRVNPLGCSRHMATSGSGVSIGMAEYEGAFAVDPAGPAAGSERVIRGGGWNSDARFCRLAARY